MNKDIKIVNPQFVIDMKWTSNLYIDLAKAGKPTGNLKSQMTVLIPKVLDTEGKASLKPHPASANPDIKSIFDGDNIPLAIILGGAMEALQQIIENGENEIPVETAIEISRHTSHMLQKGRSQVMPGVLWAYGFRDACDYVLPKLPDALPTE